MEIRLERQDLLQMEPISQMGTLKLLPIGKKNKQKLLVADDSGQLSCYEFKKGEPQVVFQVRPFDGPVSCVALGGSVQKNDRIFVANGQKIVGLTKKGKEFFKLSSTITESIRQLFVNDTRIWTSCEFIYNMYTNGQESAFYINPDAILSMIVDNITNDNEFDGLLGCQDSCIRILHGSMAIDKLPTPAPVTALAPYYNEDGMMHRGGAHIIFGMDNGSLGMAVFKRTSEGEISSSIYWTVDDDEDKRTPITCIRVFDLFKEGTSKIIVCREDGRVQIFSFDLTTIGKPNIIAAPKLVFMEDIGERVQACDCGQINSTEYNEIVVAGYSGKIVSFTTEPVLERAQEDTYGRSVQTINNENRIKFLKKEVEGLVQRVEKEKVKVKKIPTYTMISPPADFTVNSKFALNSTLAAYVLTLELQCAIDLIIIRSPVFLDFVDTDSGSGSSVMSITPPALLVQNPGEELAYKFVSSFRCQSSDRRISLTIRSTEGEFGEMIVTVVASSTPKAAKVLKYPLLPLSLHTKLHVLTEAQLKRPRNSIRFTGSVPMATWHDWLSSLFPEVPQRLSDEITLEVYNYKNSFTDAIAIVRFQRNEIVIESECASTIAIVKETITRLANSRRVQLEEHLSTVEASIASFLGLIRSRLEYQISLARKVDLLDGVQELAMQEAETSWMFEDYREMLAHKEVISKEFKTRSKSLEYLSGIITDLFVDWNKLQGYDVRQNIGALHQAILSNDFASLVKVILQKK